MKKEWCRLHQWQFSKRAFDFVVTVATYVPFASSLLDPDMQDFDGRKRSSYFCWRIWLWEHYCRNCSSKAESASNWIALRKLVRMNCEYLATRGFVLIVFMSLERAEDAHTFKIIQKLAILFPSSSRHSTKRVLQFLSSSRWSWQRVGRSSLKIDWFGSCYIAKECIPGTIISFIRRLSDCELESWKDPGKDNASWLSAIQK